MRSRRSTRSVWPHRNGCSTPSRAATPTTVTTVSTAGSSPPLSVATQSAAPGALSTRVVASEPTLTYISRTCSLSSVLPSTNSTSRPLSTARVTFVKLELNGMWCSPLRAAEQ